MGVLDEKREEIDSLIKLLKEKNREGPVAVQSCVQCARLEKSEWGSGDFVQ